MLYNHQKFLLRFSILFHRVYSINNQKKLSEDNTKENHLDFFLEQKNQEQICHFFCNISNIKKTLRENQNDFRSFSPQKNPIKNLIKNPNIYKILWQKGVPHNKKYLNYSGLLSNNKGYVRTLCKGYYYLKPTKQTILDCHYIQISNIQFSDSIFLNITLPHLK